MKKYLLIGIIATTFLISTCCRPTTTKFPLNTIMVPFLVYIKSIFFQPLWNLNGDVSEIGKTKYTISEKFKDYIATNSSSSDLLDPNNHEIEGVKWYKLKLLLSNPDNPLQIDDETLEKLDPKSLKELEEFETTRNLPMKLATSLLDPELTSELVQIFDRVTKIRKKVYPDQQDDTTTESTANTEVE